MRSNETMALNGRLLRLGRPLLFIKLAAVTDLQIYSYLYGAGRWSAFSLPSQIRLLNGRLLYLCIWPLLCVCNKGLIVSRICQLHLQVQNGADMLGAGAIYELNCSCLWAAFGGFISTRYWIDFVRLALYRSSTGPVWNAALLSSYCQWIQLIWMIINSGWIYWLAASFDDESPSRFFFSSSCQLDLARWKWTWLNCRRQFYHLAWLGQLNLIRIYLWFLRLCIGGFDRFYWVSLVR